MKLFVIETKESKCGGCNWGCSTFYGLGKSKEGAKKDFVAQEGYGKGLCAHCMCRLLVNEKYKIKG